MKNVTLTICFETIVVRNFAALFCKSTDVLLIGSEIKRKKNPPIRIQDVCCYFSRHTQKYLRHGVTTKQTKPRQNAKPQNRAKPAKRRSRSPRSPRTRDQVKDVCEVNEFQLGSTGSTSSSTKSLDVTCDKL